VRLEGALAAWPAVSAPSEGEHIAGRTGAGALVVLTRASKDAPWIAVDVTAKTGRAIASDVAAWSTPNDAAVNLAAHDAGGHLLVFERSPAHDWSVEDASATTGALVRSGLTAWQLAGGARTEAIAGAASDGAVTIFTRRAGEAWRAEVTPHVAAAGVTSWLVGDVEHVAGAAPDGSLFTLWRRGGEPWGRVDVTAITGERIVGRPTAYGLEDGGEHVELIAGVNASGHPIVSWWKGSRDWQALDLAEITGRTIATPPETWTTVAADGRAIEHLAAPDATGHLRVFDAYDQPRTLTDAIGERYASIVRARNMRRKTLVILWDPHYPNVPKPPRDDVADAVFGPTESVRDYFAENSGGTFALEQAATVGWYDADQPLEWYDNAQTPHDKAGAALRAADADVDFAAYDADHDGIVAPHELAIVFIHPGGAGGLIRAGSGDRRIRDLDGAWPLVLDGVQIRECAELGIGHPDINFSVVAHEMSHLLFNLPDMYFTFFTPTAAGTYSLMDSTYDGTHLDPFNKLKMGWVHPRLVFRAGEYTIPDIETHHRALVLADPKHGAYEYFVVENRWRGDSYDRAMKDEGLGVWHIMEPYTIYDAAPVPPNVEIAKWNAMSGPGAWGRKAIQMLRPRVAPPFDNGNALWKAATGYDLVSNDADGNHPSLRWWDLKGSGFALRKISAPGPAMTVTIDVP
jgi:M6 family metalloprotease-like protein